MEREREFEGKKELKEKEEKKKEIV